MPIIYNPPRLLVPSRAFAPDILWAVDSGGSRTFVGTQLRDSTSGVARIVPGSSGNGFAAVVANPSDSSTRSVASWNQFQTSNGAGGGDFTLLVLASPTSSGDLRALIGQRGASAYQGVLYANLNATGDVTAGSLALFTLDSAVTGAAAAGQINGQPRVFAGRRSGTAHSVWVDGVSVGSSTGTARTITSADSRAAVGGAWNLGSWVYNTDENIQFQLGAVWNRALSDAKLARLGQNPWLLFEPQKRRIWVPVASGNVTLAGAGRALVLTGGTATVTATANVTLAGTGKALTLTGGTATVTASAHKFVSGTGKALVLTGGTATVVKTAHQFVTGTGKALTFTGGTATIEGSATVTLAGTGRALVLAGGTATVTARANVTLAGTGKALTLTGGTATAQYTAHVFVTGTGNVLSLVGGTATITAPVSIVVQGTGGALVLRGGTASITSSRPVESATGGWAAHFRAEQRRLKREDERRKEEWTREQERELARLLKVKIRAEDDKKSVQAALGAEDEARLADLVAKYATTADRSLWANRTARAIDYAERAQTELAYQLALREIARQLDEEMIAIALAMAAIA